MQGNTVVKVIAGIAVLIIVAAIALAAYRSGGAALIWQMGGGDPVVSVHLADEGLYVVGAGNVSLVDASGRALWSIRFPNATLSAYVNGRLLAMSRDAGLCAIGADGSVRPLTRLSMNYPPAAGPNGSILIRSYDLLTDIDASGREAWNASGLVSGPAVDGLGNVYFFRRPPERATGVCLECVSPAGDPRWSMPYGSYGAGTRLKASADGVLVYDEAAGALECRDADGNVSWDHTMPYLGQYRLVEDEGRWLYLFYAFGTVHVVNGRGTLIGKFNPAIAYDVNASYAPAVRNGTVYVAGDAGAGAATVYALGIDGALKWKRTVNTTSPPEIYAGRGVVCVGASANGDRLLYVLRDGGLKFAYRSGDGSGWEQVIVGDGGTIYAKTYGGTLYALKG